MNPKLAMYSSTRASIQMASSSKAILGQKLQVIHGMRQAVMSPSLRTIHRNVCQIRPVTISSVQVPSVASAFPKSSQLSVPLRQYSTEKHPSPDASAKDTKADSKKLENDTDDAGMDLFAQAMSQQKKANGEEEVVDEAEKARQEERIRRMKEAIEKEQAEKRAAATRYNAAIFISLLIATYAYLGIASEDDKTQEGESELAAHQRRVNAKLLSVWKYFMEPPAEKLLPDPLPGPYQPAYTLCIELNDSLIQLVWDKTVGWRAAIRPWARDFLANLARYYEIVIFTTSPGHLAEPVVAALDPFQDARYRLYRDHTKFENNIYIKDISKLNRDPSKVILLDVNPDSFKNQPENGILLKKWTGELNDEELLRYQPFFEELYFMMMLFNAKDLRPFLKIVKDIDPNDIPAAWEKQKNVWRQDFDERQQEMTKAKAEAENKSSSALGGIISAVGSVAAQLVGAKKSSGPEGASTTGIMQMKKIENVIDTVERAAREEREAFKKEQANRESQKEQLQKEYEEMIRKQMEENKAKKLKLVDYFMGAGQPAVPGAAPPSTSSS